MLSVTVAVTVEGHASFGQSSNGVCVITGFTVSGAAVKE
jgi:hypothetical protein